MSRVIRVFTDLPRLLMVLVLVFAYVVLIVPLVSASPENMLDNFDVIAYDNDDGTIQWEGPWSEIGEASDPASGDWTVSSDLGFPGYALKVTGQEGTGVLRSADLDGFTSATLRFRFRRERLAQPKSLVTQVSSSGSAGPWTTVHTISGAVPQATDPLYVDVSVDISQYLSSSTTIRFMHGEGSGAFGANMAVYIDDVEISGERTNRAPVLGVVGPLTGEEGSEIGFLATASDPDGDEVVFSLEGAIPAGASITPDGIFTWTPDESQGPGSYQFDLVVSDAGSPTLTDSQPITVTVAEVNQAPHLSPPEDQLDGEGSTVTLPLEAADPDLPTNTLTWQAWGLPPGLDLGADGVITGTITNTAASNSPHTVTVEVTDDGGMTDQATFTWTIADMVTEPVVPTTPVIDEEDDDSRQVSDVEPSEKDSETDDASLEIGPSGPTPTGVAIPVPDEAPPAEVESENIVADHNDGMVTTVKALLAAVRLLVPDTSAPPGMAGASLFKAVDLFTKAFFHTILAMNIPTLLLGFAAITLVGLKGVSRYPVLFNRRSQHYWSAVMLGREKRLPVHKAPDTQSDLIYKLGPTTQSLRGTGAEVLVDDVRWLGVSTPAGEGWVESWKVTEQVDAKTFLHDKRPLTILNEFLERLQSGRDVTDLVSERGLVLVLAEMTQVLDKPTLSRLLADASDRQVRGGGWSPHDFHLAVVRPLLEAHSNTPVVSPHVAHAETSLLPSPMRNFRYLALGGDDTQPWLVFFEYSSGKPRIVGLTIDE